MTDPAVFVVSIVAAVVAAIAAAAAIWQAYEARKARTQAQTAQGEAEAAESRAIAAAQRAADASERSAKAHEEQAAIARAAAKRFVPPWRMSQERVRGATVFTVTLGGDATWSDITWEYDVDAVGPVDDELPETMHPGQALRWVMYRGLTSATQATLEIRGMPAEDEDGPRIQRFTFIP